MLRFARNRRARALAAWIAWIACSVAPVAFAAERPNLLLIVADDLGYSDLGSFGSEIYTPALDEIAAQGLRLTNFHVLPSCAPTRSVLLTGTDNHVAGIGSQVITPAQRGRPGYEGHLNRRVAALPEILAEAGYRTYMSGKWHLGEEPEHGPHARGFDESFALLPGGGSHYADLRPLHPGEPMHYRRNGQPVESLPDDFYSTRAYTDHLLGWLERDRASEQPFFAYLAYTAPHDPLHAPRDWIAAQRGRYDAGYEVLRERRFEAMKELGLIAADRELPPWPDYVPRWAELSEAERAHQRRDMEIYAAMVAYLDAEIRRVVGWLERRDELADTWIVFLSDNGPSGLPWSVYPTSTPEFRAGFDNALDSRGAPGSFVDMGAGWATASAAGLRLFKIFSTEGGIRVPALIRPPEPLAEPATSDAFAHVRDLLPTFLEIAGATHPVEEGADLARPSGRSLLGLLRGDAATDRVPAEVGYELHGTRAYVRGRWKALQMPLPTGSGEWELFDLERDPFEIHDLARARPEVLAELIDAHAAYEREHGVVYDPPTVFGRFTRIGRGLTIACALLFALAALGSLRAVGLERYRSAGLPGALRFVSAIVLLLGGATLFGPWYDYGALLLLAGASLDLAVRLRSRAGLAALALPGLGLITLGLLLYLKSGALLARILA